MYCSLTLACTLTNVTRTDVQALAKSVGFPGGDLGGHVFLWCLVQLQRRIVLGSPLHDADLACWLFQYANHLVSNCKSMSSPQPAPFKYDASQLSTYKITHSNGKLTFARLTRLLLNPSMKVGSTRITHYVKHWDDAIQAQINFRRSQTDANWKVFTQYMDLARELPF
jgi:hypothetical protein